MTLLCGGLHNEARVPEFRFPGTKRLMKDSFRIKTPFPNVFSQGARIPKGVREHSRTPFFALKLELRLQTPGHALPFARIALHAHIKGQGPRP